jgi:uncharacterized protein YqeY
MKLREKIGNDITVAMKARDKETLSILRVVTSEVGRFAKDDSDVETIRIIKKLMQNAKELGNLSEAAILASYLPVMYTSEEIRKLVFDIITENGFKEMRDMGKVMGIIKQRPDGSLFDGKITSTIVKEILMN